MRCFVVVELEQSVRSAIARFVLQELPAGQIDTPDERAVAKAKDVNGVAA